MNPDFRDLLAAFNARGVDFLIVGAHALAAHGLVRVCSRAHFAQCPMPRAPLREYSRTLVSISGVVAGAGERSSGTGSAIGTSIAIVGS